MNREEAKQYLLDTDEKLAAIDLNILTHGTNGLSLAEAKEYYLIRNKRETATTILKYSDPFSGDYKNVDEALAELKKLLVEIEKL